MDKFWLLKPGLGVLLTFIGTKMLLDTIFHIEISTMASLFVILGILIVSISASLMFPKKDNAVQ
jgi:tellurite resistance protein TerC